jgi:hypothetical protein
MRAKLVNEISKAEDDWANAQIDKWLESQKSSPEDYETYLDAVTNFIWDRLTEKLSAKDLKYTNTTKERLKTFIDDCDSPYGLYMCVADYWQENAPADEAANLMFDEVYRNITAQGGAM